MYENNVMKIIDKFTKKKKKSPHYWYKIDTKIIDNNTNKAGLMIHCFQKISGQDFIDTYSSIIFKYYKMLYI